jgi:hypothetical protein
MSVCDECVSRNECIEYAKQGIAVPCDKQKDIVVDLKLKQIKTSDVVTDGLKHDGGKPMLALVPSAIIRAVGEVMTHGAEKYGKNSWRGVDPERYKHALMRHICEWLDNPYGKDKDSGLPHLWHVACNVAFLLELDKEMKQNEQP